MERKAWWIIHSTMDSAALGEWQHLAGTMQETTHVIVHYPGSFHIHLPQHLARIARGFLGPPYWLFVCHVCFLADVPSSFLFQLAFQM